MASKEKPNILERFIMFSEYNAETMKIVSYGIASISLITALYRIRPFAKFRKPYSVPSHFLRKKVPLQGTVMRIEPSCGTLLMVDHKSLIPLPRLNSSTYLPVKIAGVNVMANGVNWLQTIINGKKITFIPVASEKEYLSCIVTTSQQNQEQIRVGEELVRLGFALANEDSLKLMSRDKEILKYQKRLLSAQTWAQRKRNGHWHFVKYPTLLWKVQQSLIEKLKSMLPASMVQQLNI